MRPSSLNTTWPVNPCEHIQHPSCQPTWRWSSSCPTAPRGTGWTAAPCRATRRSCSGGSPSASCGPPGCGPGGSGTPTPGGMGRGRVRSLPSANLQYRPGFRSAEQHFMQPANPPCNASSRTVPPPYSTEGCAPPLQHCPTAPCHNAMLRNIPSNTGTCALVQTLTRPALRPRCPRPCPLV
jgi:hypothetical protein